MVKSMSKLLKVHTHWIHHIQRPQLYHFLKQEFCGEVANWQKYTSSKQHTYKRCCHCIYVHL
jgi:hypothetical protein